MSSCQYQVSSSRLNRSTWLSSDNTSAVMPSGGSAVWTAASASLLWVSAPLPQAVKSAAVSSSAMMDT